jgi:hypothetical protein
MKKFIASSFKSLLVLLLATTALWSCQKDLDETLVDNINQIPNLTTKISSSVSGFVVDENNQAVAGATVVVYDKTTTTDDYGYFSVKNVNVVKTAAVVTVNKSGYFPGIKTYIATENKSAFFRIKLIPKLNSGSFNGLNGGTITLSNGMKIEFPVNGIQDLLSSNNNPYSGTVNVSASYIDPTASDINSIMPGDLRGINQDGSMSVLQSFGMVAVELKGDQGQALQIASGKKATLTFPIPSSLSSTAPASIPLWYFDESNGLWKEEGSATKVGNNYVGDVTHFSFWNCDVPSNFVQFNCTLLDEDGVPIPFTWVKITNLNNPQSYRYGLTDSSGFVAGAVPNNANLKLEVFTQIECGTAAFTQTFNTLNANVSLGNLSIPNTTTQTASISGTVTDCNNAAVSNGYIIMLKNSQYYRYNLSSTGAFNFSNLLCNGNSEGVTFIAEDNSSNQQSSPFSYTLNTGNNTVPNLQACGTTTEQFFNYSVNGASYSITSPVDSFISFNNPQTNPPRIEIHAQKVIPTMPTSYNNISIGFSSLGIAVGSTQSLTLFYTSEISDSTNLNSPILVNITEYGSVGQFISGNYTGTVIGGSPTNTIYNVTGSFRVRRRQ